jgi:hypothetical protein
MIYLNSNNIFLLSFLTSNLIFYHQISSCLHHKSIQQVIYINTQHCRIDNVYGHVMKSDASWNCDKLCLPLDKLLCWVKGVWTMKHCLLVNSWCIEFNIQEDVLSSEGISFCGELRLYSTDFLQVQNKVFKKN